MALAFGDRGGVIRQRVSHVFTRRRNPHRNRITVADHKPRTLVVAIRDGFDKALPGILRARRRHPADVDD